MSVVGAIMVPHPPIILPEVGRGEEKKIAATAAAYEQAAALVPELRPDTIVLASPHSILYSDYFHISPGKAAKGDMGQFRAHASPHDGYTLGSHGYRSMEIIPSSPR